MPKEIKIVGYVLDREGHSGLGGLLVEARIDRKKVGSNGINTDESGKFELKLRDPNSKKGKGIKRHQVDIVVKEKNRQLKVLKGKSTWPLEKSPTEVKLYVDRAPQREKLAVEGIVQLKNDRPSSGIIVRVFEKKVSSKPIKIAEAETDAQGKFAIHYRPKAESSHIIVSAFPPGKNNNSKPVATVMKTCASAKEKITLTISNDTFRGQSEFDRIHKILVSKIRSANTVLDDDDVAILVTETKLKPDQIKDYSRARKLAKLVNDNMEVGYALSQVSKREDLKDLFSRGGLTAAKEQLKRLVDTNHVSPETVKKAESHLGSLHATFIDDLVQNDEGLGGLLKAAGVHDLEVRKKIATVQLEHGVRDALWDKLKEQDIDEATITELKSTYEVNRLIVGNLPLLKVLRQQRRFDSPKELAKLSKQEWRKLLGQAGENDESKIDTQISKLMNNTEEAFPTTAVARGMREHNELKHIQRFIDKNDTFDFARSHIPSFLKRDNVKFVNSNRKRLSTELLALQRIYRISPEHGRYETMRALYNSGYDSALKIARIPKKEFIEDFSPLLAGSDDKIKRSQATTLHERAKTKVAKAVGAFSVGLDYANTPGKIIGFEDRRSIYNAGEGGEDAGLIKTIEALLSSYEAGEGNEDLVEEKSVEDWCGSCEVPDPDEYPNDPDLGPKIAEYRELFGSIDFRACKHSESVLGPAAYLVDLLQWLDKKNLLTSLIAADRRPDIADIKLDCSNTDSEVPYIDLTNEILENKVSPDSTTHNTPSEYTAKELLAQPVFLNQEAYNKLGFETPPRSRGLDLWENYSHEFLSHLKVSILEIIEAFKSDETLEMSQLLGLTRSEIAFVTQNSNLGKPDGSYVENWTGQGNYIVSRFLSTTGLEHKELLDLLHARSANYDRAMTLVIGESPAKAEDPCDLSKWRLMKNGQNPTLTDYLNLHRFLTVWRSTGFPMLELDKAVMTFSGNSATHPDWNKALENLACVVRLQRVSNCDLLPLLALWRDIDIEEDRNDASPKRRSLYDQIFQDPTMDEASINVFELSPGNTHHIRDHRPAIQAALGLSGQELRALELHEFGQAVEQGDSNTGPVINLRNLSKLYRHVVLACVLNVRIQESLAWQRLLSTMNAFAGPKQTVAFVELVCRVRNAGIHADDALYYFNHDSNVMKRYELDDAALRQHLWNIRNALREVPVSDEDGQIPTLPLREFLVGHIADPGVIDELTAIIAKTSTKSEDEQRALVDKHLGNFLDAAEAKNNLIDKDNELKEAKKRWEYVEQGTRKKQVENALHKNLERARIEDSVRQPVVDLAFSPPKEAEEPEAKQLLKKSQLPLAIDPSDAERKLVNNGGQLKRVDQRVMYLSANLIKHGKRIKELERLLSGILALDMSVVDLLLRDMTHQGRPLVEILLDPQFIKGVRATAAPVMEGIDKDPAAPVMEGIDKDPNPQDQEHQFKALKALRLLIKVAGLYKQLEIGAELHRCLVKYAQPLDIARPWLLPPDDNAPTPVPSDQWLPLIELRRLEKELQGRSPDLPRILSNVAAYNTAPAGSKKHEAFEVLRSTIALRTGWPDDEIRHILLNVIGLADPGVSLEVQDLFRLAQCGNLMHRTAASSMQLSQWNGWLESSHAFAIREIVASRFDHENWLEVSRGIHDRLRMQQRDALISYLINNYDHFHDSKDIYAYFLIDPEMNPCRTTSRVRLAISSVQLYVQRHFLGLEAKQEQDKVDAKLEAEQVLDEVDAKEWKWRKQYRIWEVNRKVFLYPENWIHPELRKDKSEIFELLENELQQKALNSEAAEQALTKYVDRLEELSSLEISGLYLDSDVKNLDELNIKEHMTEVPICPASEGTWEISPYETLEFRWSPLLDENSRAFWSPDLEKPVVLHIFARTRTKPRRYFYRVCELGFRRWSTWQSVNLTIEGDHVIPVVRWGHVFLFWLSFSTKDVSTKNDPKKEIGVRLNYSELSKDGWSSIRTSEEIFFGPLKGQFDSRKYWLVPLENLNGEYLASELLESDISLLLVDLSKVDQKDSYPTRIRFHISSREGLVQTSVPNGNVSSLYNKGNSESGRWRFEGEDNNQLNIYEPHILKTVIILRTYRLNVYLVLHMVQKGLVQTDSVRGLLGWLMQTADPRATHLAFGIIFIHSFYYY